MLFPLWRRLWSTGAGSSGGQGRHVSYRPRLEALEDRLLPAPLPGWALPVGAAPAAAVSGFQPGHPPLGYAGQLKVTVFENSPATVINLNTVFAGASGIQHKDGLQMSLMGNTNPGLVRTDLSKAELTLNYTRGPSGTATILVAATDADGVCVKESILVTVCPLLHRPSTGGLCPPPTTVRA